MAELLRLIREAIGVRPLIPIILILLAGIAFTAIREYPVKELLYDRYYLLTVLTIIFVTFVHLIWTSTLAERTPAGRYGVYVARIRGDSNRDIQKLVIDGISPNLLGEASKANIRIEVRDLKLELSTQDLEQKLPGRAATLNATVVIFGNTSAGKTYLWFWSQRDELTRSPLAFDSQGMAPLTEIASQAWERVDKVRQTQAGPERIRSQADLENDIDKLRAEVAELRARLSAGISSGAAPTVQPAERLSAILVGIGDYGGQVDLAGPPNDVSALRAALNSRNKAWRITSLVDKDATKSNIEETIRSTAASLPEDEPLLVYFSGHIDPDERGSYRFYMSDLQTSIDIRALITQTLEAHPKTVFLIDGRFDPSFLDASTVKQAAVLTAEAQGMAYESLIDGKSQGAFTAALLQALNAAGPDRALSLDEVFRYVQAKLKKQYAHVQPRRFVGRDAPFL